MKLHFSESNKVIYYSKRSLIVEPIMQEGDKLFLLGGVQDKAR